MSLRDRALRLECCAHSAALLVPSVILLSTTSTLIAAGSHLVANDLLSRIAGRHISFAEWLVYGVPFGVAASLTCCIVILGIFLTPEQRRHELRLPAGRIGPLTPEERRPALVAAAMIALWAGSPWHGFGIAIVSLAGAMLLGAPAIGVLTWADALRVVNWNLIVFVGAALSLGEALIETRAAA
jgi:di/tricarboxylate transporter